MKIIVILLSIILHLTSFSQNNSFKNKLEDLKKIDEYELVNHKDKIEGLYNAAKTNFEKKYAELYFGKYYKMTAKYDTAEVIFIKSVQFFKKVKSNHELALSYKHLGLIKYNFKNDFIKGKAYLDSAIQFYTLTENKLEITECKRHIAVIYYYLGNIKDSNKLLQEIISSCPIGSKQYLDIKDLIVNNFIALNNMQAAYNISKDIPKLYLKINEMRRYAYSLFTLGHLQKKIGKIEEAEQNLLTSYNLSKKKNYNENLIDNTRYLGLLYTEKNDFIEAKKYLFESLAASRKIKDKYSEMHALSSIGRYYIASKNYKLGDSYTNEGARIYDSLYTEDNNKKLAEYEVKYKTAEKAKQLITANLDNERKQKYIVGLLIGIFSLTGFGLLTWKIKTDKQKRILQEIELENSRKVLKAREIERQRIAKELHDSVGSQLTVVSTSLDNAYFLAENQKLIPQKLESINEEVRLAAQSLRDTIWATHNSSISISNLNARIVNYFGKITESYSTIKITNHLNELPNISLNSLQALHIFRIIQEAFQNILKHSKALNVTYNLKVNHENELKIHLADDGIGFDKNSITINENFGLSNMKNRATEIGGELIINSQINNGTEIILKLKI